MRYKDWKSKVSRHHERANFLERSLTRRFLIRGKEGEQLYLHVRPLGWPEGDPHVSYTLSHEQLGFIHDPLTELTAADMRKIANLKYEVERWVSGMRDSLPDSSEL